MIQMTGRSGEVSERYPDFQNVAKDLAIWVEGAPDWFFEELETWDQKQ